MWSRQSEIEAGLSPQATVSSELSRATQGDPYIHFYFMAGQPGVYTGFASGEGVNLEGNLFLYEF